MDKLDLSFYQYRSKTRRNWIKSLGIYASNLLEAGNSKLSNNILIFDLLAGDSCLNSKDCIKTCYAIKAQKRFSNVKIKRYINTYLAKNDLERLKILILTQLHTSKKEYVRIHSSGDFLSQEYIDMWDYITKFTKHKKFYFYTKVAEIFDFTSLVSKDNVNIINSILPDGSINYGNKEYVFTKSKLFNIPICPYGMVENRVKCGETCNLCMNNNYMLFLKH